MALSLCWIGVVVLQVAEQRITIAITIEVVAAGIEQTSDQSIEQDDREGAIGGERSLLREQPLGLDPARGVLATLERLLDRAEPSVKTDYAALSVRCAQRRARSTRTIAGQRVTQAFLATAETPTARPPPGLEVQKPTAQTVADADSKPDDSPRR